MALRDPKLEKFAQALASNIVAGMPRSAAAEHAAAIAGYAGRSMASNARKRAQRDDVKKRIAEILAPAAEKAHAAIEATVEWATTRLVNIASPDLGEEAIRTPDQIAAIKLLAQIKGWLAPEKTEHSGQVTLEQLVMSSMKPKEEAA